MIDLAAHMLSLTSPPHVLSSPLDQENSQPPRQSMLIDMHKEIS
jgi:hypothetical protein